MKKIVLVLCMSLAVFACEKNGSDNPGESEKEGQTAKQAPAGFTAVDGTTDEGIQELNATSDKIVEQVVQRHGLDSADVDVRVGDPSGLGFTVTVEGGKKVKMKVPPSKFPAELVTNFDHTLDRAIRRAAGLDEK